MLMLRNDKVFLNRDVEKCQGIYGAFPQNMERSEMVMLRNVKVFS